MVDGGSDSPKARPGRAGVPQRGRLDPTQPGRPQDHHNNTAVDLLRDLERFGDVRGARVGDLDNYVRSQGSTQFDVLASDEDAASAASIDADAFNRLHSTLVLVPGGPINYDALSPQTRKAWLRVSAAVADGL